MTLPQPLLEGRRIFVTGAATGIGVAATVLNVMAELRIPRINTVSVEPDRARAFDELAALTALAAERSTCSRRCRTIASSGWRYRCDRAQRPG